MSERMTVVIVPQDGGGDGLTVEDAMRQVLDVFELLAADGNANGQVVWRLLEATTNSPFRVVAEATPSTPGADIDAIAKQQKREFSENISSLRKGRIPAAWSTGERRKRATSLFKRTRSIAKTIIGDPIDNPIEVTRADADIAEHTLSAVPEHFEKPRDQIGSVDGFLIQVGTHYGKPAIQIRDRKSGLEMWCQIPEQFRSLIATEANFDDVWSGRRVVVHGTIVYDRPGVISRVIANDIQTIESRAIGIDEIKDRGFTGGLSVAEYIEKLREGTLGG